MSSQWQRALTSVALTSVALTLAIVTPTVVENRAMAQVSRSRASTVLTSANGKNLTQAMVNDAIAFGEFLAGDKFTPSEKSWLKDLAIKEFRKAPASEIQAYNIVAKVLSQIKQLNNPVMRARARENAFTYIYLRDLAEQTLNEPSFTSIVYKHSPVIAADPTSQLVVTKRGIESYFEWYNFTQQLLGRPLLTNQQKAERTLDLQQAFRNIPVPNRMMFAAAESHWLNLQQVWSKSSPEYKQQKVAQLKEIAKNKNVPLAFNFINIALESRIYLNDSFNWPRPEWVIPSAAWTITPYGLNN